MDSPENTSEVLKTMEESKNTVSESKSIKTRRMASTYDGQQPKMVLENGADVKCRSRQK